MKTIGFICPAINDDYLVQLLRGVSETAAKNGFNFIAYVSQGQNESFFPIIDRRRVDGLVIPIHYFTYSRRTEAEQIKFLEQFKPLPIVCLGKAMHGFPAVTVDNTTGFYEEIAHLIKVHHYKRIAYIGGPEWNPEALERDRTYHKAMADHGVTVDPRLVFHCNWGYKEGEKLISEMIDERKVRPEAIVASNDNTAVECMEALSRRGIRVPADIAMVGFDDIVDSRFLSRPLTTVRQPVFELGSTGAQLLIRQLSGETELPPDTKLGTIFLVRQSCGCLPIDVKEAVTTLNLKKNTPAKLESARQPIEREAAALFHLQPGDRILKAVSDLFDAFRLNLETESAHVFINTIDDMVRDESGGDRDQLVWQALISIMRRNVLPLISEREETLKAENLFHQGRIIVAGGMALSLVAKARKNESYFWSLANNNALLSHIADIGDFSRALTSTVKNLNVLRCYIALVSDKRYDQEAELLFAYDATAKIEGPATRLKFAAQDLVPTPMTEPFSIIVQPLLSRSGPLGFMTVEMKQFFPQVLIDLWRQCGSTLNGLFLLLEIREQNHKLESEIKAREEIEKELQFRAFHDTLTKLPNRALFLDRLGQAAAAKERRSDFNYALLFIDLDGFKKHNDTHGHEAGDELLVAVAERLRKCVRSVDTLARLGGDEFTILLSDLSAPAAAEQVAKRVLEELTTPFELKLGNASISASIGIALSHTGAPSSQILQNADLAMYRAKSAGKARYVAFSENLLT